MDSRFPNGLAAKLAQGVRVNNDRAKGSAALARGPNKGKKLNAAAWSGTWPAPTATLDLDFANDRGFVRGVGSGRSMDAVTFTRASNGTFVGSDGKLAGSGGNQGALGLNLLTFPQNFDNAAWSKTNSRVVSNAILAPDGTQTATKLIATANGGSISQSTASWPANTASIIDLQTGLVTSNPAGSWTSITSESFANGWWRIKATYDGRTYSIYAKAAEWNYIQVQVFTGSLYAYPAQTSTSTGTADNNSGIFIWGAQLELGSTATTYYPTNINTPRFDWASTATVAGNLLTYTEDVSQWAKYLTPTITLNTTVAPDGTTTADTVIANAASQRVYQRPTIPVGTYTFSVYVKSAGAATVVVGLSNLGGYFSSITLTFASGSFTFGGINIYVDSASALVESVGNGWFRCKVTFALNEAGAAYRLLMEVVPPYTNGIDGVYVWGAQLEAGSSAKAYQAIGAQLPTNTPLAAASTCNGLLIEESRTNRILWCRDGTQYASPARNLFKQSQTFTISPWGAAYITLTANATTAPDTTNTATLAYINVSGNFRSVQQNVLIGCVTFSIYAKASGSQWFRLADDTSAAAWFDVVNGVIGTINSGYNASITSVGNGWYRCSITKASGNILYPTYSPVDANGGAYGTANGTNGIYIWGAQAELYDSATTYEVTTTTSALWTKTNCTVVKNQTGIDGVANAATSITATSSNAVCAQVIGLASGSRTGSVYLKRITGTGNVQVSLDGSTWSTVDLSSTEYRRIVLSGTVTNPVVGIRIATSGDAVAMDYAQVEDANNAANGQLATSPILTTSATATRAVDIASNSFAQAVTAINLNEGTLYAEYAVTASAAATAIPIEIVNQNQSDYVRLQYQVSLGTDRISIIPSGSGAISGTAIPLAARHKAAGSFTQSKTSCVSSGGTPGNAGLLSAIPKATNFYFGRNFSWGYITRVVFIPKALSESALQVMTGSEN